MKTHYEIDFDESLKTFAVLTKTKIFYTINFSKLKTRNKNYNKFHRSSSSKLSSKLNEFLSLRTVLIIFSKALLFLYTQMISVFGEHIGIS